MTAKTLVLGVGNTLLTDEGAGVHTIRYLRQRYGARADVEFVDAGTLSFTLAGLIEDVDRLIIVDAAQLRDAPGTVRVFEGDAMDGFLGGNRKLSVHEVSLIDLLAIARLSERLPARRALVGIQPQAVDWGEKPTAAVAGAIPQAGELVVGLIDRWNA